MSKYIDAEKLREEIEFAKSVYSNPHRVVHGIADAFRQDGRAAMCDEILSLITSLQQKHPERICPHCVYLNKTNDSCEYPYGGRNCLINENGVCECNGFEEVEQQEQEQSEVDLEKDIEKICDFNKAQTTVTLTKGGLRAAAYHFYELGLKAGKEE